MAEETKNKKGFKWSAWYMIVVYVLAGLMILPIALNGLRVGGRFFVNYYRSIIYPAPPAPSPRYREQEQRRGININIDGINRRDRRKPRDEKGINWDFNVESAADISVWVSDNIPETATEKETTDISDAFYASADAIYDGETSTPGRSISFLKKRLMMSANDSWETFFKELTTIVSYESINSMEQIAELYETIGDAISQADVKPGE